MREASTASTPTDVRQRMHIRERERGRESLWRVYDLPCPGAPPSSPPPPPPLRTGPCGCTRRLVHTQRTAAPRARCHLLYYASDTPVQSWQSIARVVASDRPRRRPSRLASLVTTTDNDLRLYRNSNANREPSYTINRHRYTVFHERRARDCCRWCLLVREPRLRIAAIIEGRAARRCTHRRRYFYSSAAEIRREFARSPAVNSGLLA